MPIAAPTNILADALAAYDAGLCVIRVSTDGKKKPLGEWKHYQSVRPSRETVIEWFKGGYPGMGAVTGAISGDAEMFELEGRFMSTPGLPLAFLDAMKAAGLELMFKRLTAGYQAMSPSGGRHFIYRVTGPIEGNTKLAHDAENNTIIETRGEGGFVVLAPSHGPVHPTGNAWKMSGGSWDTIVTITSAERDAMFEVARSFDLGHPPEPVPPPPPSRRFLSPRWQGNTIADSWMNEVIHHLEQTRPLADVLTYHGWTYSHTDRHGRDLYTRPGKEDGVSGSINENGRLCPFSTSTPFRVTGNPTKGIPPTTYDTLDAIAIYEHAGDRMAAARHIAETTGIMAAWQQARDEAENNNLAYLLGDDTAPAAPPNIDPVTGEINRPDPIDPALNLPDQFWDARPALQHIRQAAHSRSRCADSVLVATLARVATLIPPTITLPAIVGSKASLNFFGAIVSRSGGGKSTSSDVARELVPFDRNDIVDNVPPGSGEGLIEMYLEFVSEEGPDGKRTKVKRQTKQAAYVFVDEGQALMSVGDRQGNITLPILRSAWSGSVLGQQNASQETNRRIGAHQYRMGLIMGFQLAYAATLIADGEGGTPQRFVFMNATDAAIPDDAPEWPGPLPVAMLPIIHSGQTVDFDRDVAAGIRARNLAAQRGESDVDPLDTHTDLGRMKVAAILAYLDDGRLHVTPQDWELAGMVMDTSRAVRSSAIATARARERDESRGRTAAAVSKELAVADAEERRVLVAGAKSLARRAHKAGQPVAKRDLMAAVASRYKRVVTVDEMISHAEAQGWIEAVVDGWKPGESRPI